MKTTHSLLFLVLIGAAGLTSAKEATPVDPAAFANAEHRLGVDELRRYVIARDKLTPDFADAMANGRFKPQALNPDGSLKKEYVDRAYEAVKNAADKGVGEILGRLGEPDHPATPPFTIDVIRKEEGILVASNGTLEPQKPKDEGLTIPGLIGTGKQSGNSLWGPLRLRKTSDDWSSDLSKAQGANANYTDNRKTGSSSWSTEGALIYPIAFSQDNTRSDPDNWIRSSTWRFLPATTWKVLTDQDPQKGDVEELQFQVPVAWSANHVGLGLLRNSDVALSPYFLTDFGFKGAVEGVSLSYTPYVQDYESGFALNSGYKGLGSSPFLYRLGLVPSADFNHLSSTSRFISRAAHTDYFRAGGKAELGLRTMNYPSIELLASYQAFAGISGAPDYSDLVTASAKLWINEHAGITLNYQVGTTPVAQKDIDLITLGIELKF